MLTLQETRWTLKAFKICSILNIFPIGVDVKSGKIERQSNKVKVFIWKILFSLGVSHWFYIFARLVQSTVIEPEKYFRWDHFILHFKVACFYATFYFTGFRLFVKSPEENVIIFNQLFEEREDPVQKMMDREEQMQKYRESGNGKRKRGNKARTKSVTMTTSAQKPDEGIEMAVIENGSESESESDSEVRLRPRPRPLLAWPVQYSLDELVAKLLPLVMMLTGFSTLLVLAIDPSRPQLLYSSLPPEWQNPWSFLILLAVEVLPMIIIYSNGSFAIVTQVLFFAKCQSEFRQLSLQLRNLQDKFPNRSLENGNGGRDIAREIWILHQILEEIRELVVLIELFNRCFPLVIFAAKIFSLSFCIIFYFFVIRHFEDFPFLAVFVGYSAIVVTFLYTIMYEHAFSIPGKMEELKKEFLLTAQKTTSKSNENKSLRGEMKREIKRIHGVGIKVGSFHQMERQSTPNFIDFLVNQVVSLLVTFPR